jgi:hypothetical protein
MQILGPVTAPDHSAHATIEIAKQWRRGQTKFVAFAQERRSRRVLASAMVSLGGDR